MLNNIVSLLNGGAAAAANSFESIATVTVGAGGSSTITFSSIPSTYKHLQLRAIIRGTTAANEVETFITYNGTSTNYYRGHQLYGWSGSTTPVSNYDAQTNNNYLMYSPAANATASVFGTTITDILDYSNTNKYKTIRSLGGFDASTSSFILFRSGLWMNTAAISQIDVVPTSGNFAQYTQFALYGVK